jgi:nitroreductase
MNVLEAITNRRSVRAYSSKPIPPEVMARMRQALRQAPSACNLQPWHFILVEDESLRQQVATAAKGQMWLAPAPVIVVACGLPDKAYKHMGGYGSSVDVDLAIAVDHLTLAAVAEGLGTCWIGAFDEGKVKAVLGIPAEVKVVVMTPLGYPAMSDLIRPIDENRRKSESEVFSINTFKVV